MKLITGWLRKKHVVPEEASDYAFEEGMLRELFLMI